MRRNSLWVALGLLGAMSAVGCDEESELPDEPVQTPSASGDAGANAPPPSTSNSASTSTTSGGTSANVGVANGLPCDVAKIVEDKCVSCHSAGKSGPMPLLTQSDFAAASLLDANKTVAQAVKARIHDTQRPMPPLSANSALTSAELAAFDAWLDKGAPKSGESCGGESPAQTKPEEAVDLSQCEYLSEFKAHNGTTADDSEGYKAPLVDDHYECFNFEVPWDKEVQAFRFDPIINDERVVHHWILYSINEERPAGSHDANCGGKGRTFLAGWAPGQKGAVLPDDTGLLMPRASTATLQLEVHYNNLKRYEDVKDRSGVRICASSKLRKNTAAVHTLGSTSINLAVQPGMQKLVNSCQIGGTAKEITIMSASPHMHQLGRHMTTTIKHKDGKVETLVDVPFDFRDQTFYPSTIKAYPGDVLTTTCTFENTSGKPVKFGEGTGDEMCFNFVTAYPAGSLVGGISDLFKFGENSCIGLGADPFFGL